MTTDTVIKGKSTGFSVCSQPLSMMLMYLNPNPTNTGILYQRTNAGIVSVQASSGTGDEFVFVGTKVDLRFDPDTLRIEDLREGDEDADTITTTSLVDQLKRGNSIKADAPEQKDTIGQAMNMREFLKKNDL